MKRREFLGLVAAMLTAPYLAWADRQLDILILGGTGFIGPHDVESALGRGHRVSLFNRGKTNPYLFPQLEKLVGDRAGDLSALEGRSWDVVLDISGFQPAWVQRSTQLLKGSVGHYVFLSDVSVYRDQSVVGQTEDGELQVEVIGDHENPSAADYGAMKGQSEQFVRQHFPVSHTILRLGVTIGPGDPTDRFTYWPARVFRGGEVLAPGSPSDPVQFIDVRDLATWTMHLVENKIIGTFNVSGPDRPLTMGGFLDAVRRTTNSDAQFTWVSPDFLASVGVSALVDLPLWVPPDSPIGGFTQIDISRALEAGLTFRPIEASIADSLAWYRTLPEPESLKAGLSPERERLLLAEWKARREG